jgi:dihydrofolate reductase
MAELKKQYPCEVQVHGSSDLIQTLIEHDLVDEFRILTFPVTLGTGKRLFGGWHNAAQPEVGAGLKHWQRRGNRVLPAGWGTENRLICP